MNRHLLPPHWRPLAWFAALFLAIATLTRLALRVQVGAAMATGDLRPFLVGLGFDLVTLLYAATPLVLLLWLVPRRGRIGRVLVEIACVTGLATLLFVAVAEWTFWQEFQTRFNFIAVDYLVYTTEVIGNIRQSYPVGAILAAIGGATAVIAFATRRWRRMSGDASTFAGRTAVLGAWLLGVVAVTFAIDADLRRSGANAHADELAGNGIYEFFAAYRNATLDYDRFYRTVPIDEARAQMRAALATPDATFLRPTGIDRMIRNAAPERRLNVVLISVESLSGDYTGTLGAADSYTPQLDALTSQSLVFTRLYATGTRTVRGLEALSLSVPPTPGESIVKRPDNGGLFSLASVFNAHGYASEFLYGGYGAFDNMNAFFGANGYAVHDRTEIPDADIHHANIWGVADEDLYTLALRRFDAHARARRPFFAHVLTTSNHRPYTFPAGRGPWPQKQRESAVRYSDWAVADFLRRARTRPWFADTIFVITADHCASSAGKAALPAFRYRIPLWIYSPAHVKPARFDGLASQIDLAPTVLGLLGFDYRSRFYGVDVFQRAPQRAYIGTYELLGLMRDDALVQLSPHRRVDTLVPSMIGDAPQPPRADDPRLTLQAIAAYQTAADAFDNGAMRALPASPAH